MEKVANDYRQVRRRIKLKRTRVRRNDDAQRMKAGITKLFHKINCFIAAVLEQKVKDAPDTVGQSHWLRIKQGFPLSMFPWQAILWFVFYPVSSTFAAVNLKSPPGSYRE